jgi:hypothetical protein
MNALAISQRVIAVIVSDSSRRTGIMVVTGFLAWHGEEKSHEKVAWWRGDSKGRAM